MTGDDLAEMYRAQAAASMEAEAARRVAEVTDPVVEARLRSTPLADLVDSEELVPALLTRLGAVRGALEGHGGGIKVSEVSLGERGLDIVLNLDGACIACGAAPGTLQGIQADLISSGEVERIRFDASLLETFDELGREFVLKHGGVTFV